MTPVDEVKARLDIVDIIEEYLQLKRAGKNLMGFCPFHAEKTGSFVVFPESQRWHCFGACQEGGDIFSFVMKREGWDFAEALKYLARKAGVELRPQSQAEQRAQEIKRGREEIFGAAMAYFQGCLPGAGQEYALSRGWTPETIQSSGVGYFGMGWDGLREHLRRAGVDLESAAAVAMVGFKGDVRGWAGAHQVEPARAWVDAGKIPAMPPDMLIYPHLMRGRVAYLAGRRIYLEGDQPKSWNPPMELAGERQPFFNHHWYAISTRKGEAVMIVEGQGDGVSLGQLGAGGAALVGLSLGGSERGNGHDPAKSASRTDNCLLSELKRKQRDGARLLIGLDSDEAGQKAVHKLAGWLLANGWNALGFGVLRWPEVKDANDWLKAGGTEEGLRGLMEGAPAWLDVLIDSARPTERGQDQDAERAVFSALTGLDLYEIERRREEIGDALQIRRRTFDALLRAARREAGQGDDGQPRYFVEAGRIFSRYFDQAGNETMEPLCNFEAQISEDLLRDNGLEVVREFRLKGKIGKRNLTPARVKADEFNEMKWVLREWGSGAIIEAGTRRRDQLRTALQYLSREVSIRTIYTHTGWREVEGKRVYLSANGAVGVEGIEVELDQDLDLYQLPRMADDPAGAMRDSLSFLDLAPDRATFPLWGAMWLAPLRELVNVAFALWIFGATGTLKSTLAAAALNHYGAGFDDKHMPSSFVDTANRLEQKCFVVKDMPLVIDDFAPQKDAQSYRQYTASAHRIIRDVGNLTGRGRLNADATAKNTYVPRSLVIITGEDIPESESIMARLFVVELNRGDVDKEKLTAFQAKRERLPHAMSGYLLWLAEAWGGLSETLPKQWRDYRQHAFGIGFHLRLPEAVAGLYLGIEMGLRYAVSLGVIAPNDLKAWKERGWYALAESAQGMIQRVQEEKPEELFIRTFRELLTQGKIFLRHKLAGTPNETMPRPVIGGTDNQAELMGWYDEDFYYLLPDAAYSRIAKYYRDQGNVFPVRKTTLHKMLEEAGVLVSIAGPDGVRRTRSEWMGDRNQRVVVLKRTGFEEKEPVSQTVNQEG